MQQPGGTGANTGMMAGPSQQQIPISGGLMHRGGTPMLQHQAMMGPGGQIHHTDGGMTPQAQMQARMQMESMQAGHQHNQQQPVGPGSQGQGGAQEQQKLDNISRVKQLLPNLKESVQNVMKSAAQMTYVNNIVDNGTKPVDVESGRFEKAYEEFSSICDQMEMNLITSIECLAQGMSSNRYLPTPVTQMKSEQNPNQSMTYLQYIATVNGQIAYAKEVHDALTEAAQKIVE